MFNISTIKTALLGKIGFRDSRDATVAKIDGDLTASSTGQYWEDIHSLLQTDNLYYSSPNFEGMNYAAYGVATYDTGDRVMSSSIAWESKVDDNQGNAPAVLGDLFFSMAPRKNQRINSQTL
jgi:hypothetical protein